MKNDKTIKIILPTNSQTKNLNNALCNVTPLSPTTHSSSSRTFSSSQPAGDQLVAEGVTPISLPLQEYDRGSGEKRTTNKHEQCLGLTQ